MHPPATLTTGVWCTRGVVEAASSPFVAMPCRARRDARRGCTSLSEASEVKLRHSEEQAELREEVHGPVHYLGYPYRSSDYVPLLGLTVPLFGLSALFFRISYPCGRSTAGVRTRRRRPHPGGSPRWRPTDARRPSVTAPRRMRDRISVVLADVAATRTVRTWRTCAWQGGARQRGGEARGAHPRGREEGAGRARPDWPPLRRDPT